LQLLCRRLVDIANRDGRQRLGPAELAEALGVIDRETFALRVFWDEFCDPQRYPEGRATVGQILRGEPPGDRASLERLQQHGYILPAGTGWRLRVPLFAQWIRDHGERVD